ncbi:MAG TPA: class II fructose-bisphosphate aldolase, partial [Chloroflexota bacterium]
SRREHFAVGAFNVDNQETLLAIVRAPQAKEAPVLVEVSHDEISMIGLANMRALVDNYRAEYGVEIHVNLDHSPSVEAAKAGIDAGFEFPISPNWAVLWTRWTCWTEWMLSRVLPRPGTIHRRALSFQRGDGARVSL